MPEIKWNVRIQVTGGPAITRAGSVPADAYDLIELTVPAGEANTEVQVVPAEAGVTFLLVAVTPGGDEPVDATFRVNADDADEHAIDAPVMLLMGKGPVGLLGAVPQTLFFTNKSQTQPVDLELLVGRDATP
jgi:hypothetical protein